MLSDFPRYSQRSRRHAILRRRRGLAVLLGAILVAATVMAIGIAAPDQPASSSRAAAAIGAAGLVDARPVLVRGGFTVTADRTDILDRPGTQGTAADLLAGPPAGRSAAAYDVGAPTGSTADLAVRMVAAEGGPGRSATSSAAGYGQFLRTTWLDVFGRAYPDIARMLSSDQILALRYVKPLALDLTSRYARENAATLVREGLPATDTALSLAHAVGAGGAMTVLTASPRAPVADLLSRQAIAANPVFTRMTADDLRSWAANRIAGDTAPQPSAPPPSGPGGDPVPMLAPGEDFLVDGKMMASEVLQANHAMIGRLREVTNTPAPIRSLAPAQSSPSPAKVPLADRQPLLTASAPAAAAVLDAIATVSHRSGYGQFHMLARRARALGRLPAELVRDLALVLIGKMEEENVRILGTARHRRGLVREAQRLPAQRPADRTAPPVASSVPRAGRS